ncbi:hypothetical protein IVB16_33590 [Bradyrhizobium sp. 183]|uniref:hypothetical protein n=1 Tax=unclassified Bradyrhizobium TaxID=2631580 RepID=UPI001FFEDD61|nr:MULTISPECIES: hypothetical protein [unclassified Bradyrhizobium]UPJ79543.1 hypothetical protein IVB17_33585 [Bradyrhizobium sp. 184]UPJ87339.1 hypothetical protein IVB16_33590 [Bradyrhizobium sp. 183]
MYFAQSTIDEFYVELADTTAKRIAVLEALLSQSYQVPRAQEFAAHGVSRRLRTMELCLKNVFAILPTEVENEPSMNELVDAVIQIQAFIFNAFACVDNIAWIWVCEQKLTTDKGEAIAATHIGLSKNCRIIRRSLPTEFREHLVSLNPWFAQLEDFRHALAHCIPLAAKYELLEKKIAKALRRGRRDKAEQLAAEQPVVCGSPTR